MGGICSDKSRGRGEGDVFQLFSDDFQKTKFVWPTFFVFADFPDDFPDDSPDDFPHDFPVNFPNDFSHNFHDFPNLHCHIGIFSFLVSL